MILLRPNITNKVALTLTEKVTIANPNFLFELENNQTREKYYFIAEDISLYPYSYNLFEIVVKANPNPLQGEVNLTTPEEYIYNVYEQVSPTNLDPTGLTKVETGILRYDLEYTQRNNYTNGQTTRKVYQRS